MADEKIINIADAKERIQNTFKPIEEQNDIFDELTQQVQDFLKNEDDQNDLMSQISVLLALPDKEFNLIAPITLEELEKMYSRPEEQLTMAHMFNAAGITMDDLQNNFEQIMDAVDVEFGDKLSKEKIMFLKTLIAMTHNAVSEASVIDKRIIRVPYEICREGAKEPTYAHPTDAGMDVYALDDIIIDPGETVLVPTGIKMEIPKGYAVLVHPRSGLSLKSKLRIANSIGLIDADYRGEIKVIMENTEPKIVDFTVDEEGKITSIEYGKPYVIGKGEKFAQLRLVEVPRAALTLIDKVNETERAEGGFGSTGA